MKREIWKLNLKTCKKNLWMQSDQYSQRALNNLCSCVTEPIGWRQYFCPSPSKWVSLWGKCNPHPPPEEYCSLLDTRQSFKFAASVVIGRLHVWRRHCLSPFKTDKIWPILQQKSNWTRFSWYGMSTILGRYSCGHTQWATTTNLKTRTFPQW